MSEPQRDWLVTFARKVALERDTCARQPGRVFCVMLSRDEAEGLLEQLVLEDDRLAPEPEPCAHPITMRL